jgi:mycofactocin precursor
MEKQARKEFEHEAVPCAEATEERPEVLEEIEIEDLTIDGICGVY